MSLYVRNFLKYRCSFAVVAAKGLGVSLDTLAYMSYNTMMCQCDNEQADHGAIFISP